MNQQNKNILDAEAIADERVRERNKALYERLHALNSRLSEEDIIVAFEYDC